ncbi:tRNA-dihydrouridine synthase [Isoptericola jiangsuensis]|uniref:tRNA-dihydrouridine synthase n=1 Tax=Isoptericola jiangsuensis TaxID=548579 RepID=UPI003AAAAA20
MTSTPRRMRSVSVTLGVTALVAASLTGCSPEADNRAICVDPETELRVDDDLCDEDDDDYHGGSSGGGGHYWYYVRAGSRAPAVGSSYVTTSGTYDSSTLRGTTAKGGVSSDGGSVSRGGFGGSGKSGS